MKEELLITNLEDMTIEEKIKELKFDKLAIKLFKLIKSCSIGVSIAYEYELVKSIFENGYINHMDCLDNPRSYVYIIFVTAGLAFYIEFKELGELLENDMEYIQNDLEKTKEITY